MDVASEVRFANQRTALLLQIDALAEIASAIERFGFTGNRPVLVLVGGASKLSQEDFEKIRALFLDAIAPAAQKWQAFVVDGGTDAGVMRLMGEARQHVGGTFPLIGVAPIGVAEVPDCSPPDNPDSAPLEPNHTHFLLVPGSNWGDESPYIARTASLLAGNAPSLTVLINGGEVTWRDAQSSIQEQREVIVVAGSGRTADQIAAGLRGEESDARATSLIATGVVKSVELAAGFGSLLGLIDALFAGQSQLGSQKLAP